MVLPSLRGYVRARRRDHVARGDLRSGAATEEHDEEEESSVRSHRASKGQRGPPDKRGSPSPREKHRRDYNERPEHGAGNRDAEAKGGSARSRTTAVHGRRPPLRASRYSATASKGKMRRRGGADYYAPSTKLELRRRSVLSRAAGSRARWRRAHDLRAARRRPPSHRDRPSPSQGAATDPSGDFLGAANGRFRPLRSAVRSRATPLRTSGAKVGTMAEESNTAKMARIVFSECFEVFGWETLGPLDWKWPCESPDLHDDRTMHPTDLVCRYDDPYFDRPVYVNVELKSYAADSIDKAAVAGALRSLATATDCLHSSETWQKQHTRQEGNWVGVGLLFWFNHDHKFAPERFAGLVHDTDERSRSIATRRCRKRRRGGALPLRAECVHDRCGDSAQRAPERTMSLRGPMTLSSPPLLTPGPQSPSGCSRWRPSARIGRHQSLPCSGIGAFRRCS